MKRFRTVAILGAAVAAGVFLLASAAAADSACVVFDATLDATFTDFKGAHASGIIENGESNLGDFEGTFERKLTRGGRDVKGTTHFVFADGATMDTSFHVIRELGSTLFAGTFTITGGTGRLAGACGEGTLLYDIATSPIPVVAIGNACP